MVRLPRDIGTSRQGISGLTLWGKIIGGVTGFMTGGPLGAVVGAALGHAADQGTAGGRPGAAANPFGALFGRSAVRQAADAAALLGTREQLFAITVVVLAAKLAKCDGPVKRAEIDTFKRLFRIPPENMREVASLFDQARDSADPAEPFAEKLGEAFADNKGMLEDVLAALFQIARADGPLTRTEVAFLQGVQRGFGLDSTGLGAGAGRLQPARRPVRRRTRAGRTPTASSACPGMPRTRRCARPGAS